MNKNYKTVDHNTPVTMSDLL